MMVQGNVIPKLKCQSIVVLTGAGISAESGLQTLRGHHGLWQNHRAEDLATPEAFKRSPELVHQFYNNRRLQLFKPGITPNPAHLALAKLERLLHGEFTLITQNVDNLHERADSSNVIHMHGELLKQRCLITGEVNPCHEELSTQTACPCCGIPGQARPHVVWFGETPLFLDKIHAALNSCDLFVAIGTSGLVYPAAGFVETALESGAKTIELNIKATPQSSRFQYQLTGPAGKLVPALVEHLLDAT